MSAIVSVQNVSKIYDGGFKALNSVSIDINEGETPRPDSQGPLP